ncbi:MAG: hypothetical protein M1819_002674 [Sarea resinae]|nr:MAG: hypothetical protein M1819_002674 [Sarea resinae]
MAITASHLSETWGRDISDRGDRDMDDRSYTASSADGIMASETESSECESPMANRNTNQIPDLEQAVSDLRIESRGQDAGDDETPFSNFLSKESPFTGSSDDANACAAPGGYSKDSQSYFNPFGLQRTNSVYSLSRASLSSQLSQLTSLQLPQASSLSTSITAIPTSPAAARALIAAAEQIRKWISKASEVLSGLDSEDDVEWAAAGGREGLGEVDNAVARFEDLIGVYVGAIEELQSRKDISSVPNAELKSVVGQMDKTLREWDGVRRLLTGVKQQVELAMEWEELWSSVLGEIEMEMDALSKLIFEMEERRHRSISGDRGGEPSGGIDIGELETIVEETPTIRSRTATNNRFSLPAFATGSTAQAAGPPLGQDDSSLLALFARMQPLRASLDFLPMRLSGFQARGERVFPTACEELEIRRNELEEKWQKLNGNADALRRELGEDRWLLVFRNAGRQAQKMCDSVARSITKLREAIDAGLQHSNPPALAQKVESYEAKKMHYGPAIQRVLAIIEKGIKDRLTVHGEILTLHADMGARSKALEADMKDLDGTLEEIQGNKNQELRESISTIISMDRSARGSSVDTPDSSPASSIVLTGAKSTHVIPGTPGVIGSPRPGSESPLPRGSTDRRYYSMPPGSIGSSNLPRKTPTPRSGSLVGDGASPSSNRRNSSNSAATTISRSQQRPSLATSGSSDDNRHKPRWNSSTNTHDLVIGHHFKPSSANLATPSPNNRRSSAPNSGALKTTPRSASSYSSIPVPSPLRRERSSSPSPPSSSSLPPTSTDTTATTTTTSKSNRSTVRLSTAKAAASSREVSPSPARFSPQLQKNARLKNRTSSSHLPSSTPSPSSARANSRSPFLDPGSSGGGAGGAGSVAARRISRQVSAQPQAGQGKPRWR